MHHPHHDAFFEFREVTNSLSDISEAQAILTLKYELLHALERANDYQQRERTLRAQLDTLQAETTMRAREQQAFSAQIHHQLTEATREIASAKADREQQVCAMRSEVLAMENRCEVLDEICHSLLLTIERAACLETAATAPTQPSIGARSA
jgi:hypothetical protein